jgi:hypothetical protein
MNDRINPIEPNGTKKDRVWDMLTKATVPITMIVATALISHEVRLSRIEENRFTDLDGAHLHQKLLEDFGKTYPPKWLLEDVKEIKDKLRDIEKAVSSHAANHVAIPSAEK